MILAIMRPQNRTSQDHGSFTNDLHDIHCLNCLRMVVKEIKALETMRFWQSYMEQNSKAGLRPRVLGPDCLFSNINGYSWVSLGRPKLDITVYKNLEWDKGELKGKHWEILKMIFGLLTEKSCHSTWLWSNCSPLQRRRPPLGSRTWSTKLISQDPHKPK